MLAFKYNVILRFTLFSRLNTIIKMLSIGLNTLNCVKELANKKKLKYLEMYNNYYYSRKGMPGKRRKMCNVLFTSLNLPLLEKHAVCIL